MRAILLCVLSICIVACTQKERIPTGDPSLNFTGGLRGYAYKDEVVAGQEVSQGELSFSWAQEILSQFTPTRKDDLPSQVGWLPEATCEFKEPAANSNVHHVHVASGSQETAIYAVEDTDVSKRALRMVEQLSNPEVGKASKSSTAGDDNVSLVNVVVTKTDAPVYLVLTSQAKTIWNIHRAEDAVISNIVLVGNQLTGLANPPKDIPINTLYGRKLRSCASQPARMPRSNWRFVQNVKSHNIGADLLVKGKKSAKKYSSWFQSQFGTSSYNGAIEARELGNALIGPKPITPEHRVPFQPLKNAEILLSPADHIFVNTYADYKTNVFAIVKAAAEEAAGGDLSLVTAAKN